MASIKMDSNFSSEDEKRETAKKEEEANSSCQPVTDKKNDHFSHTVEKLHYSTVVSTLQAAELLEQLTIRGLDTKDFKNILMHRLQKAFDEEKVAEEMAKSRADKRPAELKDDPTTEPRVLENDYEKREKGPSDAKKADVLNASADQQDDSDTQKKEQDGTPAVTPKTAEYPSSETVSPPKKKRRSVPSDSKLVKKSCISEELQLKYSKMDPVEKFKSPKIDFNLYESFKNDEKKRKRPKKKN